jgi:DNA-binding transcriptional MerR regulator
MNQWYVKQFGKLTGVSVRTLHHYDKIGLLKPSGRSSSGYRLYSEVDLLKLQQIIALKYFGLNLTQIKKSLAKEPNTLEHLETQRKLLAEQIAHLSQASKTLHTIIGEQKKHGSINWHNLIKLIERYRMTKELKKTWAGQVYTDEQLQQFAEIRQKLTPEYIENYQKRWAKLIAEVEAHLDKDPKGPIGKKFAKLWMSLLDEVYGQYPELKYATEKAYKEEKIPNPPCSKEVSDWMEIAVKDAGLYK